MLKYEKDILDETKSESFVLVGSYGIHLNTIINVNIMMYLNKYSFVFLLNFNESSLHFQHEYFRNMKNLDKLSRRKLYAKGGVFLCSSRVLLTDFLEENVDFSLISAIIIDNADKIKENSLEAFIMHVFRRNNQDGLIKAFSSNCIPFAYGIGSLEKYCNSLQCTNFILYPRFHANISESFKKEIQFMQHEFKLTEEMIELQMILIEILKELIKINKLDVEYELILVSRAHLTRQIPDISDIKYLINLLISCNPIKFYMECMKLIYKQIELGKDSTWLNSNYTIILIDKIDLFCTENDRFVCYQQKEALLSLKRFFKNKKVKREIKIIKEEGKIIREEDKIIREEDKTIRDEEKIIREEGKIIREEGKIIRYEGKIIREDIFNLVSQSQICDTPMDDILEEIKNLNYNPKFVRLVKLILNMKEDHCIVVFPSSTVRFDVENQLNLINRKLTKKVDFFQKREFANSEIFFSDDDLYKRFAKMNADLNLSKSFEEFCIFYVEKEAEKSKFELFNSEFIALRINVEKTYQIILYEKDLACIRKCEYLGNRAEIIVHSFQFKDSLEEQNNLLTLRKEISYFEQLIQKRSQMPLLLNVNRNILEDEISDDNEIIYDIVVDSRELRADLPFFLYKAGNNVIIATLQIGDYLINENICIERKNISDFISSLKSGRLYTQARMLTFHYHRAMLLLEFNARPCLSDFYSHNADTFRNSLISKLCLFLITFPTVKIIWSESTLFTTKVFRNLQYKNIEEEEKFMVEVDPTIQEILLSIPGINQFNLRKVVKNYKNIKDIVTSSISKLQRVIGQDTGYKIYKFFNEILTEN